ncbi:hypothetical protein [Thermomonospora umbrina]|uniref:hypothetical protein n=1 Tax=Thermomonospora umbrina TaxID=111806 RepID=UPI001FE6AE7C|nr:hypothetical protein [Thermomonospora umbrina]
MGWAQVFVGMAFAGLLVLAACSFRVYLAVRGLGRELERTRRRLAPKQSALRDELRRLGDPQESDTAPDGVRSS